MTPPLSAKMILAAAGRDITPVHMTHGDPNERIAANDNDVPPPRATQLELDLPPNPDKAAAPASAKSARAPASKKAKPPSDRPKAAAAPQRRGPRPAEPEADVVSLKRERISREQRMRELNELADQAFAMSRDCYKYAQIGGDTPQESDAYVRQWGLSVATHSRVLATIHKHADYLNSE